MMRAMHCHCEKSTKSCARRADVAMYDKDDSNTTHSLSNSSTHRGYHQHAYTASLDSMLRHTYSYCLHNGPSSAKSEQVILAAIDFSAFDLSVSSLSEMFC